MESMIELQYSNVHKSLTTRYPNRIWLTPK